MSESLITLSGWLGAEVKYHEKGEVKVAHLRVGTTPRRFDREKGEWVDGETQWYTVTAWRQLAENCMLSLHRGDPVVVHGRVKAEAWTNNSGVQMTSFEVEAGFVGHDLNRGVSTFQRTGPAVTGVPDRPEMPTEVDTRTGELMDGLAAAPAA